jgi:DNA polymerase I
VATYLLLDGNSLAFRAWFALKEAGMRTSSGQETQAVYGFVSMTTRMLADFHPDGMAVAWDRSEPTFRDEIAKDYKSGRPTTPEPLLEQLQIIRQFVRALGVPDLDAVGYEADDVLATLASRIRDEGDDVIVVTGDRDTYQLVEDPHVRVLYNRRGVTDYVLYDEAGIAERVGVPPNEYPFLASLRGDPSDNLPGVPGVGEKTAAKLVSTYHDVDTLYEHLDEQTPKLREALRANEEQVRVNLRMTPLVRNVPLEFELKDLGFRPADREELERLLNFLEMHTLKPRFFEALDQVGLSATPGASTPQHELAPARPFEVPEDPESLVVSLRAVDGSAGPDGGIGVEVAWGGIPGRSSILGLALASQSGPVVVAPGDLVFAEAAKEALVDVLGRGESGEPRLRLVGHRLKELIRALRPQGVDVNGVGVDTAVVAYLLDPADGAVTLEELAERRGYVTLAHTEHEGDGQLGFDLEGESGSLSRHAAAARRAEVALALSGELVEALDEAGERQLYEQIERPLIRVLAKMEVAGIGVDVERLREINSALTKEAEDLETTIHELAGVKFNVNSSAQLREVLYDRLQLTPGRKTKTGYSTDAATLEKLRTEHPMVEALLRYREVEKLRSTYGEGLLSEVAPDNRIHASFNQTVARTGRLSSDRPNLHNIPVRSEEGRQIRQAFVPAPGTSFLIADYNQIELRVIAHLSGDPGLVEEFSAGHDIHAATAARIYGVEPEKVTVAQRSKAKMVSYGLAYGMEAYGLSQRLGVDVDEAAEILRQYFVAFPSVRAYMDNSVVEARKRGCTETELGRRRYIPELLSDNYRLRQAAERQAMNAGIQGLAADIFKLALVRLDAELEEQALAARLVLQVHDEVLVEVPEDEHDQVERIVRRSMEEAYPLKVPLEVHLTWAKSWAEAK